MSAEVNNPHLTVLNRMKQVFKMDVCTNGGFECKSLKGHLLLNMCKHDGWKQRFTIYTEMQMLKMLVHPNFSDQTTREFVKETS